VSPWVCHSVDISQGSLHICNRLWIGLPAVTTTTCPALLATAAPSLPAGNQHQQQQQQPLPEADFLHLKLPTSRPSESLLLLTSHCCLCPCAAAATAVTTTAAAVGSRWVSAVCCLPSGTVLSGGMDGCLWLWPAGTSGFNIPAAHAGPVAKVASLGAAAAAATGPCLAVSCSYDKTVKVWEIASPSGSARSSRGGRAAAAAARQVAVLAGHDSPVLELAVQPAAAGCTSSSSSSCDTAVFLTGELTAWFAGIAEV
jgi:WD40 repeat protein